MTRIFESSHRLGLSAAAALLLAAPPALADSVFERFVNFHYIASQIDSGPNGGDSVDSDIGAGFQITSGFWDYGRLIAEVDIRKYDDGSADFDLQSSSVGIGAGTFLLDRVYVMGALSYDDFRTRLEDSAQPTPNNTVGPFVQTGGEDGLGLQLGLGVELIEALEVYARYKSIKFDVPDGQEDTETVIRAGVRYAVAERFNLLLEYETFDELEVSDIRVGFGLTFGD